MNKASDLAAVAGVLASLVCWASSARAAEPVSAPPAAQTDPKTRLDAAIAELDKQRRELDGLRASLDANDAVVTARTDADERFRVYGFTDVGLQKVWVNGGLGSVGDAGAATFVLGDVNLYFDARPFPRWQALTEIHLTTARNDELAPNGAGTEHGDTQRRAAASLGGVLIERAYLQYTAMDWLTIRAGYWLTPYGIWNVDHGAPTLISVLLPQFVVSEWFPTRQLGVDLLGDVFVGGWDLQYHAYISNGRTAEQSDTTDDKMVGGRIAASTTSPHRILLGASGFYGNFSSSNQVVGTASPFDKESVEKVAYREFGLAFDASLDVGPVRFRTEWVMRQVRYEPGKRDLAFDIPGLYLSDTRSLGAYALVAWRLPVLGLEPYGYFEIHHEDTPFGQYLVIPSGGVNVHFSAAAQLKLQYAFARAADLSAAAVPVYHDSVSTLASRFVLAF